MMGKEDGKDLLRIAAQELARVLAVVMASMTGLWFFAEPRAERFVDEIVESKKFASADALEELKVKLTRAEDDREALGRTMTGLQTQLNSIEQLSRETRSMLAQMLLMGRGQPPKP